MAAPASISAAIIGKPFPLSGISCCHPAADSRANGWFLVILLRFLQDSLNSGRSFTANMAAS
jgi:hypothetical protein